MMWQSPNQVPPLKGVIQTPLAGQTASALHARLAGLGTIGFTIVRLVNVPIPMINRSYPTAQLAGQAGENM